MLHLAIASIVRPSALDRCSDASLTFRHAVVGREIGNLSVHESSHDSGGSSADLLTEAVRNDADQMLCFMRWLDPEADGVVSANSFVNALMSLSLDAHKAREVVRDTKRRWDASDNEQMVTTWESVAAST